MRWHNWGEGWLLLCAGTLVTACPSAESDEANAGPADGGSGAGTPSCLEQVRLDQPFDIDPAGTGTQIHADAVFDGEGVWVTYNQPDDDGNFDVYLTRIACDGSAQLAPQRINSTLEGNHVDPAITLVDDGLVVVWSADNQTGTNNMDAYYRTFDRAGTPTMANDRVLETSYQGNPVAGNVMVPTVAPLPGGAFAIAAIRGLDVVSSFQVFVQRLTAAGELDGAAIDVVIEADAAQTYPTLAATAAGDLYLGYTREPLSGEPALVHSQLPSQATSFDPLPPAVVAASADGSYGSYAVAESDGRALLGYDLNGDVVLRDGSLFTGSGRTLSFGTDGGTDYAPRPVLSPGGGALFWYRNQSGLRNGYQVQRFVDDGASLTAGFARLVTESPVPPYAPAATHVGGDVYFAAWSDGTSPNFVLRGVFIDLAN